MDWSTDVFLAPWNLVAVFGYAAALVAIRPAIAAHRHLLAPLLAGVALLGTLVYLRYGVLVLTARCESCGECHHLGSLWCPRLGIVRTTVSRPVVQAVLVVGLAIVIGFGANALRTFALWLAVADGPFYRYLLTGDEVFRATFLAGAMVAAAPVPVLAGNCLRLLARATGQFGVERA